MRDRRQHHALAVSQPAPALFDDVYFAAAHLTCSEGVVAAL
jgi:hypothetical protein